MNITLGAKVRTRHSGRRGTVIHLYWSEGWPRTRVAWVRLDDGTKARYDVENLIVEKGA